MRRFPYYVLLLPVFFALHGYVQQYGLLPGREALRLLLLYTVLAALLLAAARAATGSWRKGGLVASGVLSVELFYGALYDALHPRASWLPLQWWLLLPATLLLAALAVARLRKLRDPLAITAFGNLLLLVLLLPDAWSWMRKHQALLEEKRGRAWATAPVAARVKPDVFLIIADEYAGSKPLRALGFDNSPFLDSLRRRGFTVDSNAHANYNYTEYSTASLLNGAYFPAASRTNAVDVGRCFHWITDNETLRFFRAQGYAVRNHSIFDMEVAASSAPRTWNAQWTDILRQQTLSARIARALGPEAPEQASFRVVNEALLAHSLEELEKPTTAPTFTYTHLLIPHGPYFYNASGQMQPDSVANNLNNTAAYVAYLQWGNSVYLSLVDRILQQARRPTIILLLGDHGFRYFDRAMPQPYYFMNLHAVYTSPGLPRPVASSGLVNEFRVLLDSCFGQQLLLLPDQQHFIGTQEH